MARSNKGKDQEKYLEEAETVLSRVYEKTTTLNTLLTWRVPKYEDLKHEVIHYQTYESMEVNCVLKLLKIDEALWMCVSSDTIPKNTSADFIIINEKGHIGTVKKQATCLIEGAVYTAKFNNSEFLGQDMTYLKDGALTISFQYASGQYTSYEEAGMDEVEVLTDVDDLCCDLKNMYLEALYSDFLIHVQDYTFKTHKFILAARSDYFDQLFAKNECVTEHTLDAIPGIAHEVFIYMYSGELRKMDSECMFKMYELALKLSVDTLCSRCMDYFEEHISMKNYIDIIKFSRIHNITKLKNVTVHFMNSNAINVVNVFSKVDEELAAAGAGPKAAAGAGQGGAGQKAAAGAGQVGAGQKAAAGAGQGGAGKKAAAGAGQVGAGQKAAAGAGQGGAGKKAAAGAGQGGARPKAAGNG